uniref:4-hydroxythreonine-4-phosphate dehydrogenase PdxA n=1 Tax=candidate division WOR-3 bacterium TaxID=2052148 RepID=A0A7C6ECV5_UNCW3
MIGITLGDPAGIGPEITLKALATFKNPQSAFRIIGSLAMLLDLNKRLKLNLSLEPLVLDVIPNFKYQFGKINLRCGLAALQALEIGVELLKIGKIKGIVTAPICKESLRLTGFSYPGQTEFFATAFKVKNYAMLAYSPKLKIIFVTTHKPLSEVSQYITTNAVLAKIMLINNFLRKICPSQAKGRFDGLRSAVRFPQIAVFSLNPHAFEFSRGEEKKIVEAIKRARRLGINVFGPFPADTINELINTKGLCPFESPKRFFLKTRGDEGFPLNTKGLCPFESPKIRLRRIKTRRDEGFPLIKDDPNRVCFDALVAMYHDQGMIPVKLLGRDEGVNVTLGLPFPRTSPLHGCAFDIAGKGIANPSSMIAAIKLCRKLTHY